MTPDEFVAVLKISLPDVGPDYYGKNYFSESKLIDTGIDTTDRKLSAALRKHLKRFGERVFCYELYHQLQCRLRPTSGDYDGPILQGELKKDDIQAIMSILSSVIKPLDKEFIPDFLYHSPVNFDYQQVIIEVKANPQVTFKGLYKDLQKIEQFTASYRYKLGILLVVNNDGERIKRLLAQHQDKLNLIREPEKILLMVKRDRESYIQEYRLTEIIT